MGAEWMMVGEASEMYRRLAERARDERSAWLLRLASRVLEDAAYALMTGRITYRVIEDLQIIETMLAERRLPVEPVRRARKLVALRRIDEIHRLHVPGDATDMLGLPTH